MTKAEQLRSQMAASTDPARLERMAREVEGPHRCDACSRPIVRTPFRVEVTVGGGITFDFCGGGCLQAWLTGR